MIVTKDFHSLIEMNYYIEENGIKTKDISYMGEFLNIQGWCLFAMYRNEVPHFTLQYENGIKSETTNCE